MPVWLKAAGIGSSILVLIALLIAFLKQIITFIAFLTGAIKLLIILIFIALLVAIGLMVLRGWKESRSSKK
jgi:predicted transporter